MNKQVGNALMVCPNKHQGGDALTVLANEQTGWGRTNGLAKRTNRGGTH